MLHRIILLSRIRNKTEWEGRGPQGSSLRWSRILCKGVNHSSLEDRLWIRRISGRRCRSSMRLIRMLRLLQLIFHIKALRRRLKLKGRQARLMTLGPVIRLQISFFNNKRISSKRIQLVAEELHQIRETQHHLNFSITQES